MAAGKPTLGGVKVGGGLAGAVWDIVGNMGALKVTGMVGGPNTGDAVTVKTTGSMGALTMGGSNHADFLSGINAALAGDPTITRRSDVAGDFVNALAWIKSVTIKPAKGATGFFFVDSNFSASSIGAVKIVNAGFNNDQAGLDDTQDNLGFWTNSAGVKPIKSVKHTDKTDPKNKARNWTWKPGQPLPDILDDLHIQPLA